MFDYNEYGIGNILFFDIETDGLNFYSNEIRNISCIYIDSGIVKNFSAINIQQFIDLLDRSCCLVAHNIKFDLKFLLYAYKDHSNKFSLANLNDKYLFDTMVLAHYNDTSQSLSLNDLEKCILKTNTKEKFQELFGENPSKYALDVLNKYNLNDVEITRNLFESLLPSCDLDFLSLMSDYTKELLNIEYYGINFDYSKSENLSEAVALKLIESIRNIHIFIENLYGKDYLDNLNLNSSKQLSNLLYNKLSIPKPDRNNYPVGKGFDKLFTSTLTNKDLLKDLKHPFIPLLMSYNKWNSLAEHIESYKKLSFNGKLYPTFNTTTTITGRLSCSKPNLQNISKDKEEISLRKCFVADPDQQLISIDYKQQEIVMLGILSRDENLLDLIKKGNDLHTSVGEKLLEREITKEERNIIKSLHFGLLYGLGMPALAFKAGLEEEDAIKFLEDYYNNFPSVYEWKEKITYEAKMKGSITLFSGRKWYCKQTSDAYKAVNAAVQGSSAEVTAIGVIRTGTFLRENNYGRIMSIIHDEILYSTKLNCVSDLQSIMSVEDLFGIKFLTDVDYGY